MGGGCRYKAFLKRGGGTVGNKKLELRKALKMQRAQAALVEKAAAEDKRDQVLLDQFCVRLNLFFPLLEGKISDRVRDILRSVGMNGHLVVVPHDNRERQRPYVDYRATIEGCIDFCARMVRFNPDFSHSPVIPQIRQEIYDLIEAYQGLDALYHMAFTEDPNNRPKHRVKAIINAIKQTPAKVDEVGPLKGELLVILKDGPSAATVLAKQGLYARPPENRTAEKPNKRRNKATRF